MKGIVPLYYNMRKAEPVQLNNESIYNGLNAAFTGGNIGIYSNNISKIWNSDIFIHGTDEEKNRAIEIVKLLCMENNFVIDYAKTLYKPKRPDNIHDEIVAYTKENLPHFFVYAKDKDNSQVIEANDSFVNKLKNIIVNPRINCRKLGLNPIDYTLLMDNPDIEFDIELNDNGKIVEDKTDPVIVKYHEFDRKYFLSVDNVACNDKMLQSSDRYVKANSKRNVIISDIKNELSKFGRTDKEVTDILVKFLYGIKNVKNKTALWMCYGDIIYENLENKIEYTTKEVQCVDCGKWFKVNKSNKRTRRCEECQAESTKSSKRKWWNCNKC